jgi:hypothetical protein
MQIILAHKFHVNAKHVLKHISLTWKGQQPSPIPLVRDWKMAIEAVNLPMQSVDRPTPIQSSPPPRASLTRHPSFQSIQPGSSRMRRQAPLLLKCHPWHHSAKHCPPSGSPAVQIPGLNPTKAVLQPPKSCPLEPHPPSNNPTAQITGLSPKQAFVQPLGRCPPRLHTLEPHPFSGSQNRQIAAANPMQAFSKPLGSRPLKPLTPSGSPNGQIAGVSPEKAFVPSLASRALNPYPPAFQPPFGDISGRTSSPENAPIQPLVHYTALSPKNQDSETSPSLWQPHPPARSMATSARVPTHHASACELLNFLNSSVW